MSHSIRFLGFAVLAWAGVRAASLGMLPGTRAVAADVPVAPPIATRLEPEGLFDDEGLYPPFAGVPAAGDGGQQALSPAVPAYVRPTVYLPAAYAPPRSLARANRWRSDIEWALPAGSAHGFAPEGEPALAYASPPRAVRPAAAQSRTVDRPAPGQSVSPLLARRLDRLSLSAWAMMRSTPAAPGLANAGTLGGSQAGARIDYRVTRSLAATVRVSSALGGTRGAEVAPGLRWRPFGGVPLSIIAERRQALGAHGGTSAFALTAESGFSGVALPGGFALDGYGQAGVVGIRQRTAFVDGALVATRPIGHRLSLGGGLWGGAQPGLWRLDAGPRVSLPLGRGMRLHADWRQRLAGNAGPGSGGVLTVAADF